MFSIQYREKLLLTIKIGRHFQVSLVLTLELGAIFPGQYKCGRRNMIIMIRNPLFILYFNMNNSISLFLFGGPKKDRLF